MFRCFIFVALLLTAVSVGAHGLGETLSKNISGYQIDIDYDTSVLEIGSPTNFAFRLWKGEAGSGGEVPFTAVWVRIDRQSGETVGNPTVFSAGLSGKPASLTYAFPSAGSYELVASFRDGDKTLAEASFALNVGEETKPSRSQFPRNTVLGVIGGAILGIAAGRFLFRVS
ncbi:MAG: hypothetical protein Q8R35_00475 [bacterium]|nr:hypothetical protein [bacterium]